ncbi:hypothetical protein [Streptomyces sp. TRM72054]|uniref:hypothetical protein n=1 Tax=Streptomyces sp. TRM72054 TaxID=2870562 RepID=UPI0027E1E104|nr:hypothetical protein [Streptomyces sp. TRM72054]
MVELARLHAEYEGVPLAAVGASPSSPSPKVTAIRGPGAVIDSVVVATWTQESPSPQYDDFCQASFVISAPFTSRGTC